MGYIPFCPRKNKSGPTRNLFSSSWVAVKELKLSDYIGETLLITLYTHYGNLI